jgi:hypothetical protein
MLSRVNPYLPRFHMRQVCNARTLSPLLTLLLLSMFNHALTHLRLYLTTTPTLP